MQRVELGGSGHLYSPQELMGWKGEICIFQLCASPLQTSPVSEASLGAEREKLIFLECHLAPWISISEMSENVCPGNFVVVVVFHGTSKS